MDSISSYEFHAIFDRTTDHVDFRRNLSKDAIEESLNNAKNKCERLRNKATTFRQRRKLKRAAIQYQNLIEYGFPERCIQEAIDKPKGIVAMTLKYGKTEAKARILAQRKTQIRIRRQRRYPPYPR
jgi:hypothetical protein